MLVGGIVTVGFGTIVIVFVAMASNVLPQAGLAYAVKVNITGPLCPGFATILGVMVVSVPAVMVAGPEIVHKIEVALVTVASLPSKV